MAGAARPLRWTEPERIVEADRIAPGIAVQTDPARQPDGILGQRGPGGIGPSAADAPSSRGTAATELRAPTQCQPARLCGPPSGMPVGVVVFQSAKQFHPHFEPCPSLLGFPQ